MYWWKIECIIVIQCSYAQETELSPDFNETMLNISLIPRDKLFIMKRPCTSHPGFSKFRHCVFLSQYVH